MNIAAYLEKYSLGSFVNEVEELVWQKALQIEAQTPKLDPTGKLVWEPATSTVRGHWRRKRANEGKEGYEKYLEYFPNGKHSHVAQIKVKPKIRVETTPKVRDHRKKPQVRDHRN